jgi:hypothetical protein
MSMRLDILSIYYLSLSLYLSISICSLALALPGVYFWRYPVFEAVRYGEIQWDTAADTAAGYSWIQWDTSEI